MEFLIKFLATYPKLSLLLSMIFISCFLPGLTKLKIFNDPIGNFFEDDNPSWVQFQKMRDIFGSDDQVIISLGFEERVTEFENLETIESIADELGWISGVTKVSAITNVPILYGNKEELGIEYPQEFAASRGPGFLDSLDENPIFDPWISSDGRKTIVSVSHDRVAREEISQLVSDITNIVAAYDSKILSFHAAGRPVVAEEINNTQEHIFYIILPISTIFMLGSLLFLIGVPSLAFLAFTVVVSSCIITLGIAGYWGFPITIVTAAIPQMLLSISICDCLHILSSYLSAPKETSKYEAVLASLRKNFIPTLLTSLTTAVSFLSFSFFELKTVSELGILGAIGTMMAWVSTYTIFGPILMLTKHNRTTRKDSRFKPNYNTAVKFINVYKLPIITVFTLVFVFGSYSTTKLKVGADFYSFFPSESKISRSASFLKEHFGFLDPNSFYIECDTANCARSAEYLQKIYRFEQRVLENEQVEYVHSPIEILKFLSSILFEAKEFPREQQHFEEMFDFFNLQSQDMNQLRHFINSEENIIKFDIFTKKTNMSDVVAIDQEIIALGQEFGLKVKAISSKSLLAMVELRIIETVAYSLSITILVITLILFFVLRRFDVTLIALIPNLCMITFTSIVLFLNDFTVNTNTMVVWCVCFGISVDDTIHFLFHYLKSEKDYQSVGETIANVFREVSRPIFTSTLVLSLAFVGLVFSDFKPYRVWGVTSSASLVFALLADLLFLPAFLLFFEKNSKSDQLG